MPKWNSLFRWSGCPVYSIERAFFATIVSMRRTTNSPRFPPYIKSFFVFHYFVKKASERACVSPRYPSGISRRGGLWEKIANESGERRDMEKNRRRIRGERERRGRRERALALDQKKAAGFIDRATAAEHRVRLALSAFAPVYSLLSLHLFTASLRRIVQTSWLSLSCLPQPHHPSNWIPFIFSYGTTSSPV